VGSTEKGEGGTKGQNEKKASENERIVPEGSMQTPDDHKEENSEGLKSTGWQRVLLPRLGGRASR